MSNIKERYITQARGQGIMRGKQKSGFLYEITHNAILYILVLPAVLFTLLFKYLPMVGIVIAFQNYNPIKGIFGSELIGFQNFEFFFRGSQWLAITLNTLWLNTLFIVTGTIAAVSIAIIMTELRKGLFVRISQSVMILPNFIGWAVVAMFAQTFIASDGGFINQVITAFGGTPISFYSTAEVWPMLFVIVRIWKGAGFGAIIYMAAIMGIDADIYEAAMLDGASRVKRILKITLPLLKDTIILLTLLNVGTIFIGDFGMIYTFVGDNYQLYSTTNVIDTYVFRSLRAHGSMGMTAAIGLYQSVFCFLFVSGANYITRKLNPASAIFQDNRSARALRKRNSGGSLYGNISQAEYERQSCQHYILCDRFAICDCLPIPVYSRHYFVVDR